MRVGHVLLAQSGNVYQAVLVHAHIDKRTKRRHIGDHAFHDAAHHQMLDVINAIGKSGGFEFTARVATWLFQFAQDVHHRGQTKLCIDVTSGL